MTIVVERPASLFRLLVPHQDNIKLAVASLADAADPCSRRLLSFPTADFGRIAAPSGGNLCRSAAVVRRERLVEVEPFVHALEQPEKALRVGHQKLDKARAANIGL